jgi:hypothetical protein
MPLGFMRIFLLETTNIEVVKCTVVQEHDDYVELSCRWPSGHFFCRMKSVALTPLIRVLYKHSQRILFFRTSWCAARNCWDRYFACRIADLQASGV